MSELPFISVGKLYEDKDYESCVENIFTHLTLDDQPTDLISIRKKQILNHSRCSELVDAFEGITGLIGKRDNQENNILFNTFYNRLVECHSPVYPNMFHFEGYYTGFVIDEADEDDEYSVWRFIDLYEHYWDLCMRKGWEDFYTYPLDSPVRKYECLDMLNDLVVHKKIKTYDTSGFINNFMSEWNDTVDVTGDMFLVVVL